MLEVMFNNFRFTVDFLHIWFTDMVIKDNFISLRTKSIIQDPLQVAEFWYKGIRIERGGGVSLHFFLHLFAKIASVAQIQRQCG